MNVRLAVLAIAVLSVTCKKESSPAAPRSEECAGLVRHLEFVAKEEGGFADIPDTPHDWAERAARECESRFDRRDIACRTRAKTKAAVVACEQPFYKPDPNTFNLRRIAYPKELTKYCPTPGTAYELVPGSDAEISVGVHTAAKLPAFEALGESMPVSHQFVMMDHPVRIVVAVTTDKDEPELVICYFEDAGDRGQQSHPVPGAPLEHVSSSRRSNKDERHVFGKAVPLHTVTWKKAAAADQAGVTVVPVRTVATWLTPRNAVADPAKAQESPQPR